MTDINKNKMDAVLEEMLVSNSECATNFSRTSHLHEEDMIEWLYHNLPTLPYVIDQIVNFIFSDGLTTGDPDQDIILNDFLYKKNIKGTTNYSVIQESLKNALIYGKNGLRWLSDDAGVISVNSKNYASLVDDNEEFFGFKDTVGYIISFDGDEKIYQRDLKELNFDRDALAANGVIVDRERRILILSQEDFCNLRNNPVLENGQSPLKFDNQRLKLLMGVYERLNYDLEYDGPGRIMFKLSDAYAKGDTNDIGTTEIVNSTINAKRDLIDRAKKEAKALGKEIKNSHSDSVILYSNIFENFEHLPRVTKSTEFFDWIQEEGVIMSQIFGIPSTLLSLGKMSGNVSMEKILDNGMLNSIVPMRERFATQISSLLAEKIGVDKIYFDKYAMQQAVDENDKRLKIVNMIDKLHRAGQQALADKFAQMLSEDIDDGNGKLVRLKVSIREKIKKLLGVKDK